ncbi:MAG: SGNH/GDSL hydrolase family protein [Oscillospiraceae bacterium]
MILCLGDSLTRGAVGYSYIKFLKKGSYKNKGVNGDTTYGALRRLKKYRKRSWYGAADTCIVAIGTNDLLQPFLRNGNLIWRVCFFRRERKKWATEPEIFEEYYRQILEIFKEDSKRAVLVGLTMIQLNGYPMDKLHEYNEIIRRLAAEYGAEFVDMLAAQEVECPGCRKDYSWGFTGLVRVLDIVAMLLLPFTKDTFSKARGLELTVDGVHFNSVSARLMADKSMRALARIKKMEG